MAAGTLRSFMARRKIPQMLTMNISPAMILPGMIHVDQVSASVGNVSLNWLTNCHIAMLEEYAAARIGKAISN